MKSISTLTLICLLVLSCDRPKCTNQNRTLDSYSIESKEYKNELAKEVNRIGQQNLRYWLKEYFEKDGKEFLVVNIQNKELCAIGILEVKDWSKIEGIRKRKGVTYRGAELVGLTYQINEINDSASFTYTALDHILD